MKKILQGFAGLLLLTLTAAAGVDLNGKWQAMLPDRNGSPHEAIFEIRVDAGKVTGKMSTVHGSLPLTEGTLAGDKLFFVIQFPLPDRTLRIEHHGLVTGDEIKITRRVASNPAEEFTAKRVKDGQ